MSRRATNAIAALLLAITGAVLFTAPTEARPYHHHHHGWYGPGWYGAGPYGPHRVHRWYPRCWTEWRSVRIRTEYGVVWRERPVRRCR
jgi:hypothetical protein